MGLSFAFLPVSAAELHERRRRLPRLHGIDRQRFLPVRLRRVRTMLSGFDSAVAVQFDSLGQEPPRAEYVRDIGVGLKFSMVPWAL
jgi:hypothetical protein